MSQLSFLFLFVPAILSLMVLAALLHECPRWSPRPHGEVEKRAMVLHDLRPLLTDAG
jgi:hypothetical protein